MAWRLARSLDQLRKQINAAYPDRSRASDGSIGDTAHSKRPSDHNPEADGTVDALDITHDPAHGLDIQRLADSLVASRDRRIKYIICNGRIVAGRQGPSPWTWRRYRGANPHRKHMHISVLDDRQDDAAPWRLDLKDVAPADSVLRRGSKGPFVRELQLNLTRLGFGPLAADGDFGEATERALKSFQRSAGLDADGWAGPRTLKAIGAALADKAVRPKIEAAGEVVKEEAQETVKRKTGFWEKITGIFGVGGAGAGWLFGMEWQTVAIIAGAAIVMLVLLVLARRQIIAAVKDIRAAVEG